MKVRSLSPTGQVIDSLVAMLPSDAAVVVRTSSIMMVTSGPFARRTLTAASGSALFSVVSDSAYLVVDHLESRQRDTIALAITRIPLPRSISDSSIDAITSSLPPDMRNLVAAEMRKGTPSHWPAVRGLVSADSGQVAAGLITEPGRTSEWRIVGSDGVVRRRYALPSSLDLYRVRGNRAWAVALDENDVPRVYFLALRGR